jgi:hypothetical protein
MTEPAIATEVGNWKLIGFADQRTLKRAVVRCKVCKVVREISAAAFEDGGLIPACTNCQPSHSLNPTAKSFASSVADSETRGARKRHRGEDG